MDIEKRLDKHLKKLNDTIQELIAQSSEFKDLRKLLREEDVELAIYVVPLLGKQEDEEGKLELAEADLEFLKQSGIRLAD